MRRVLDLIVNFSNANIVILYNSCTILCIYLNNSVYSFTLLKTSRNIHRGALLERVVRESGTNISKMVQRMGIARGTYYNHKNDPDLSLEQLAEYSKVLKYDFSADLPEMKRYILEEPEVPYVTPKTMEEAIEQRDYWRERYFKKAEEFNKLVLEIKGRQDKGR